MRDMNTPLPEWMQPELTQQSPQVELSGTGHVATAITDLTRPTSVMSPELRKLEKQTFEIAFEFALEALAEGITLEVFCREYHVRLSPARFRNWMFRDANRTVAYKRAKMIGAEAVEDTLIRISDGMNPDGSSALSDTNRDTLRINVRKWLLQVWNRKKYGDVKQVEQQITQSFDPSTATIDQLRAELLRSVGISAGGAGDPTADNAEMLGAVIDMMGTELDGDDDSDS